MSRPSSSTGSSGYRAIRLAAATSRPGGEEFCRQLAWRDFFHQVTAAFPGIGTADYRPGPNGPRDWAEDPDALDAWRAGRTGIPVVDAGSTGNNPRPGRALNPLRQAARFDHDGDYVRRYVPELASLTAPYIHAPWKLPDARRRQLSYPGPLIDIAR